jgi:hypothetical protein
MIAPLDPHAAPPTDLRAALASTVDQYEATGNVAALMQSLFRISDGAMADALITAVEPWRQMPEVAGPVYEHVVRQQPNNPRALVTLAQAYWLTGRGPDVVGDLANRAIAADPGYRWGWHLWAVTESDPRQRMNRWQQVVQRFPDDDTARAALADNAAGVASAEHDTQAQAVALEAYRYLLDKATSVEQRNAVQTAISAIEGWRL